MSEFAEYLTIGSAAKERQRVYVDVLGDISDTTVAKQELSTARMQAGTGVPTGPLAWSVGDIVIVPYVDTGRWISEVPSSNRVNSHINPARVEPATCSAVVCLQRFLGHCDRVAQAVGAVCDPDIAVFSE